MEYPTLEQDLLQIPPEVLEELSHRLEDGLERCGLYYRLFCRTKTAASTRAKLLAKRYWETGERMHDLFGVRTALYFKDDLPICRKLIEEQFSVVEVHEDIPDPDTFRPTRLNLVCKLPMTCRKRMPPEMARYPIDQTVEFQLRTVFSEGWHEVEHDLRYKAKQDWEGSSDLSRALNGIFATLITCDWSMLNVFDELAYRKYRVRDWPAMLKNKLRLRIDETPLSPALGALLDQKSLLASELYQVDRESVVKFLADSRFPRQEKTLDNLIFLMNELYIRDPAVSALCPETLRAEITACARKR